MQKIIPSGLAIASLCLGCGRGPVQVNEEINQPTQEASDNSRYQQVDLAELSKNWRSYLGKG